MKKLSLICLCSLFISSTLFAADMSNHIPTGDRAEPMEQMAAHEQARIEMQSKNLDEMGNPISMNHHAAAMVAQDVAFTSHPGAYHGIISLTPYDVELEDGSIWVIHPSDMHLISDWLPSDVVVITPNHNIFSSYYYRLTNQNNGGSIVVNLSMGPIYHGFHTYWIEAIDYFNDIVYLNDGSVWKMSYFDSNIVHKWLVNDTVIIGVNDGFLSSSRPNILINVNMFNNAAGIAHY